MGGECEWEGDRMEFEKEGTATGLTAASNSKFKTKGYFTLGKLG